VCSSDLDALGNDIEWQFNHLKSVDPSLKPGASVTPGMILGQTGNTGGSTGPHLDLKVKVNGKYMDPSKYYRMIANAGATPQETPKTQERKPVGGRFEKDAPKAAEPKQPEPEPEKPKPEPEKPKPKPKPKKEPPKRSTHERQRRNGD
jgi:murein DD-endopeptidase MepM/ murein hydrolase activator NlpD